jgi:photosystem I P700 chlorophyll a apoprotein A1
MFSDSAIAIQPVFAQWVQHVHVGIFGGALPSPVWSHTVFTSADSNVGLMPVVLGTADFMVHHIHAFTIHVTALILLKGVLFASWTWLISISVRWAWPRRHVSSFRLGPCVLGPFLGSNSISVVIFHFSWKMQSDVWGGWLSGSSVNHITDTNLSRSANTINGWLRDFLWSQSSQVIQSYGSALSAYGLMFLAGHFVWSFSLMFLFSGRGYWQELIESLTRAHGHLNCTPNIYPRALSITLLAGRNRDHLVIIWASGG